MAGFSKLGLEVLKRASPSASSMGSAGRRRVKWLRGNDVTDRRAYLDGQVVVDSDSLAEGEEELHKIGKLPHVPDTIEE